MRFWRGSSPGDRTILWLTPAPARQCNSLQRPQHRATGADARRGGFALLVLTAESERTDGVVLARQNVVHEAGLFQDRLGWRKAIALREDGCEEFSNIAG